MVGKSYYKHRVKYSYRKDSERVLRYWVKYNRKKIREDIREKIRYLREVYAL